MGAMSVKSAMKALLTAFFTRKYNALLRLLLAALAALHLYQPHFYWTHVHMGYQSNARIHLVAMVFMWSFATVCHIAFSSYPPS